MVSKFKNYIHSQNTGWIYSLRVVHGKIYDWFYMRRLYFCIKYSNKHNKVVATAFDGRKYSDSPKFILEEIHRISPDTELVWLKAPNAQYSCPSYVRVIPYNSTHEFISELASASVLICNSRSFQRIPASGRALRITTWHGGLGFKKIGLNAAHWSAGQRKILHSFYKHLAYDFYISNSSFLTKVYRTAFDYSGPVWRCGLPSEDVLQIDSGERFVVRQKYQISDSTKILLYVPTYRDEGGWQSKLNVKHVTDAMQQRFGGKWVLAVHWHYNQSKDEMLLPDSIDVTDYPEIQDLIKASDAAISDYSSTLFHAVQRHIPCFVYADDYDDYKAWRDFYFPLEEQPFPYALTEEKLIENILHYDSNVWDEKWKQYQIRTGHVVTGHSAEDVAKVCVDFLNGKSKADIMKKIPFETEF